MSRLFIKFIPFLIIVILSLVASIKLFNPLFYTSHDGEGHVIRMIEFDASLRDGQIPVRFAKRINHGLSYPYFNFNYPFIYYTSSGMHGLGLPFVEIFKALLIISTVLGGIGMYLFVRLLYGKIPGLVSAICYIIVPYRFLNMYVRGAVAEAFALGLLPFLFLSVEVLLRDKKKGSILFVIVLSILIVSHNITVFFSAPIVALYVFLRVFKRKDKMRIITWFVLLGILSLLVTAFFWFPALYESSQTKLAELTEDYRLFFPSISEVIYSPWGFGAYVQGAAPGKMSPQIGLVHTAIFLLATVFIAIKLLMKKKEEKDTVFIGVICIALLCFFLLFPFSLFLWDHVFYLKLVQHPWRLVGYLVFFISIAAGYLFSHIYNKKLAMCCMVFLTIILLYTNRNHIRVNQFVPFTNPFLRSQVYGQSTTSKDEHMPRLAPRIYEDPNPNGDLIASTSGVTKRTVWKTNHHVFILKLNKDVFFRDNTSYFPGWSAKVDGKSTPILYAQDEFYRLRVFVPKGKHTVEFLFQETWYRLLVDALSVLTFFSIVIFLLVLWIRKKSSKKSSKKLKTAKRAR